MRLDYIQSNLPEIFGVLKIVQQPILPVVSCDLPANCGSHYSSFGYSLEQKTQINDSFVISQPICMKLDSKKR